MRRFNNIINQAAPNTAFSHRRAGWHGVIISLMLLASAGQVQADLSSQPAKVDTPTAETAVLDSTTAVTASPSAPSPSQFPATSTPLVPALEPEARSMDLSVWGMYQHADIVVKTVMIGLLLASVVTWAIFFAKGSELLRAKRRLRQEQQTLGDACSLDEAATLAVDFPAESISALLLQEAQNELELSAASNDNNGIKERSAFRLERRVAAYGRQLGRGNGFLATIGAIAPFVGLFGTVWGIMNSFIGIAYSQTTNLAVVAPGIAEALLATALGLVAAIPAVVFYNILARVIAGHRAQVGDVAAQLVLLLSRDLDLAATAVQKRSQHAHQLRAG